MKKITLLMISTLTLAGCDNKSIDNPAKLSISQMIATGKQEKITQCQKGSVSLKCEYLSGDLLGTGKWHHTITHIANNGDVSIKVDGVNYYKTDSRSGFFDGEAFSEYEFKGMDGSKAIVHVSNKNEGSVIKVDVWNSKGKRFIMTST